MCWVYVKNDDGTFGVGYWVPTEGWSIVATRATEAEAKALVSYLNGGLSP